MMENKNLAIALGDFNIYVPNLIQNSIANMRNDLYNQLENAIIEGLKLKGFEFNNKLELEKFIKNKCRVEDNLNLKERVYYVNNEPFFLHKYKTEICIDHSMKGDKSMLIAEFGSFTFIK